MKRINLRICIIIYLVFLSVGCNQKDSNNQEKEVDEISGSQVENEDRDETKITIPENIPSEPAMELSAEVVKGKWLRPDGNYILEIKSIGKDGKLDAAYFNPRPIKMAHADVKIEDKIKVLIEFDDKGYEGSVYDLYYDDSQDLLIGSYFQATYGQTYQIAFIRYNN